MDFGQAHQVGGHLFGRENPLFFITDCPLFFFPMATRRLMFFM
jgi:hypothetical protein